MRDHYRLLGLQPSATAEELAVCLGGAPRDAEHDEAREVLLDPERRAAYDRSHANLRALTRVRARLDLESGPRWAPVREGGFGLAAVESRELRGRTREQVAALGARLDACERREEWLARLTPGSLLELAGLLGIVTMAVLLWRLDLGVDAEEGFRRHGGMAGEVRGGQARRWGVADPDPSPVIPLPPTGVLARRRPPGEQAVRVELGPRAGAPDAFVKLVSLADGGLELSAVIRAGERLEVDLEPGAYDLRYALGESWYGQAELFGPGTRLAAAPEALDTRVARPGQVFEFPVVTGGRIEERSLTRRDF